MNTKLILILFIMNIGFSQTSDSSKNASNRKDQQQESKILMCKTTKSNFLKNSKEIKEYNDFNEFTRNFAKNKSSFLTPSAYIIPVVVHVYGSIHDGETVDYGLVKAAIDELNKDFNGLNDDWNTINPAFDPIKSTLDIQFKLAKIDPNGIATNGVIMHPAANGQGKDDNPQVLADAWDNYKYMNLYITVDIDDDGTNRSGSANPPSEIKSKKNIDRVVYNGAYLFGIKNKEGASVLTHEFGHWLNLEHTFAGTGCSDPIGDGVFDTPSEDNDSTNNKGCLITSSECGHLINYENYMGYDFIYGCAKMFTQGQVTRMLAALQHPARKPLWQPSNLVDTGVNIVDTENPTDPTGLTTSNVTSTSLKLSWSASTDNVGVTGYNIYQGNNIIKFVTKTTASLSGLTANTAYNFRVKAKDADGNLSNFSTITNVTTTTGSSNIGVIYVDHKDITVNSPNDWNSFDIQVGENKTFSAGAFDDAVALVAKNKGIVCNGTSRNVSLIGEGVDVGISNNFNKYDGFDVSTSSYTAWNGKSGYIGFSFEISGKTHYGWFYATVAADGLSYTITNYAYNTVAGESLTTIKKANTNVTGSSNIGVIYVDHKDITVNSPNDWKSFDIQVGENKTFSAGAFDDAVALVAKNKGILCNGTSRNVSLIGEGVDVGISNNFNKYDGFDVSTSSYTAWNGKSGYIGFSFEISGKTHYGWFYATVAADGLSYTITNYAYNTVAGESLTTIKKANTNVTGSSNIGVVYVDHKDITVNSPNDWKSFDIQVGENKTFSAGAFDDAVALVAKNKGILCNGTSRNVSLIGEGVDVGISNNFNKYDGFDVSTSSYTAWNGKSGYIGFSFEISGKTHYGWFYATVAADGLSYTITNYAYNTVAGESLTTIKKANTNVTGSSNIGVVYVDHKDITVNSPNDWNSFDIQVGENKTFSAGAFDDAVALVAKNKGIVCNGTSRNVSLIGEGVDVGISNNFNKYDGFDVSTSSYTAWNGKSGYIGFSFEISGKTHYGWFYATVAADGLSYTITNYAYSTVAGESLTTIKKANTNISGSSVIYVDNKDVTTNSTDIWEFFRIEVGDDKAYGAWFTNDAVKLVTYDKGIVCNDSSRNVSLIGEGKDVGGSSNFITNPYSYNVSSSSYTAWNGNSGYIGFSFEISGKTHYGWFYATVAADGLSYTITNYAYNTVAGESLKTIKKTNTNKSFSALNSSEKIVSVYPNPFQETTNINLSKLGNESFIVTIYDMAGRSIHKKKYTQNPGILSVGETINKSGNYFVKIISKSTKEVHPIVKQ